jgi:hypothetical protein
MDSTFLTSRSHLFAEWIYPWINHSAITVMYAESITKANNHISGKG